MEKYETFYVFLDWLQFNTCHKEIKQYVRQSKLDLYGNNKMFLIKQECLIAGYYQSLFVYS
jgi:hypothetical protein